MTDAFQQYLSIAADGRPLDTAQMTAAMELLLSGEIDPVKAGAFLMALKVRGETDGEITGAARAMRRAALTFEGPADAVDTCGTGGDGANTYNISTAVSIVLASAGVPVAKHGNRSASSMTGAADVLSTLGLRLDLPLERTKACLKEVGIAFLFAQNHHPAMKHVAPIRRALGVRTLFNMLGPLTNPAGARRQLLGVYSAELLLPIAGALRDLGSERAWVVHGGDGLDELTVTRESRVAVLDNGEIREITVAPEDATLDRHPPEALTGGNPTENAHALRRLLDGEPGAYRDAVVLNTAAGLIVANREDTLPEAARRAETEIDSGRARKLLDRFVAFTNAPSPGKESS